MTVKLGQGLGIQVTDLDPEMFDGKSPLLWFRAFDKLLS